MHRFPVRVYYEDTDLAGVVYYANYLKFIERGRTEALRALGVDQAALKRDRGLVFVVRRVEVEYLVPAVFDDVLEVTTALEKMGGAAFWMAQQVRRDGMVLVEARVRVACMNAEGRAERIPGDLRGAIAEFRRIQV